LPFKVLGKLEHGVVEDCQYLQKGHDFFNWLKETHPNNFMIFIPTNCTSLLQLVDVILQRPLKHHAFKVPFNYWTITIIKHTIKDDQNQHIDFKMNNLKPRIYEWLHCAWKQVKGMEETIVKRWGKTRITKTFKSEF
jgi:hypothetical protein